MGGLCGNRESVELTAAMIRKGREPHSIIICGERGLGKKTMAKVVAAQLLCEKGDGSVCGQCRSCRLIEHGAHPDFITVGSSENGNYKIDDIRAAASDAYISPSEGKYKIYLIPDLDRSVQTLIQIQNTLLKLIEEPPESTVIILTAKSKEIFLDTIISRTVHLQAQEVSPMQARTYLTENGIENAMAEEAVRRSGGNIGQCIRYSQDEGLRKIAGYAEEAARAIADKDEYAMLHAFSKCDGKKDALSSLLVYMQRIVRDSCRLRIGANPELIFSQEVCRSLSVCCSAKRLADIYDILVDYNRRLSGNSLAAVVVNALTAKLFS
jgi:DNA polymerase-3 subunit delta'